jgi:succinoglycan biosynthesis protein ExoM
MTDALDDRWPQEAAEVARSEKPPRHMMPAVISSERLCEKHRAEVTVCVCTFRRASLVSALRSIARQALAPHMSLRMLVVDNDATPSAREAVEAFRAETSVDIRYTHAPGQNISLARNAALGASSTSWLAFLDDDEYASRGWLAALLAASDGAHAVFGPCQAIYRDETPAWIRSGDYHSNRIPRQRPIDTGYTSNVLIDMAFVRRNGLRFDPALGRSGGEDTMFFHAIYRRGGKLRYAEDAIAYEDVVPARLNLGWVARRRFRSGQVYAMMFHRLDRRRYRQASVSAPLKIAACAVMSVATAFRPGRAAWWFMRGTFHAGVLSFVLGAGVYQEYAPK